MTPASANNSLGPLLKYIKWFDGLEKDKWGKGKNNWWMGGSLFSLVCCDVGDILIGLIVFCLKFNYITENVDMFHTVKWNGKKIWK